jgi:hypothetical protein
MKAKKNKRKPKLFKMIDDLYKLHNEMSWDDYDPQIDKYLKLKSELLKTIEVELVPYWLKLRKIYLGIKL